MSVATPPPSGTAPQEPAEERCPLCGAPLGAEQDWCLRCGAAARTRLAATPRWRPPIIALATVIVLSLGALTAALVSLAGSSGPEGTVAVTRTVTEPASATTTPGAAAGAAGSTAGVPGASTTGTTAPGSSTTGAPGTTAPKTGGTTTAPAGATSGAAGSATTAPGAPHTGKTAGGASSENPTNGASSTGTTGTATTGASTTGAAGTGAKTTKAKNPLEKVIQAYERRHG